ncbi:MAG: PadR family transcriptional regulator [Chloroflexi bacterium]|nr:PadR family transcriptional regulator [Chloroflexota bacterium]MCC6893959.1 PadR family transcriptional regulator [Anaerolineae bacterium]
MSLPYLLLGLLSARPMSGYDLNKEFNDAVQHFWSTDQSQIYRSLYKLEAEGLVKAETIVQEDSPNKKVYRVTETGSAELVRWLSRPQPPTAPREAWLGQLYFSHHLDNSMTTSVLETYRAEIQAELDTLVALLDTLPPRETWGQLPREYQFQLLTLDYGLEVQRFHAEWFDKAIEQIKQFRDSAADGSNSSEA